MLVTHCERDHAISVTLWLFLPLAVCLRYLTFSLSLSLYYVSPLSFALRLSVDVCLCLSLSPSLPLLPFLLFSSWHSFCSLNYIKKLFSSFPPFLSLHFSFFSCLFRHHSFPINVSSDFIFYSSSSFTVLIFESLIGMTP